MSRHKARENAFQLIYERIASGEKNALTFALFVQKNPLDEAYLQTVTDGVDAQLDFLNRILARFSKGFAPSRIYKIDYAVLLLACYEILFVDDVPDLVAVNEALEIVKAYSTDKSASFVHGILASVLANKEAILHGDDDEPDNDEPDNDEPDEEASNENDSDAQQAVEGGQAQNQQPQTLPGGTQDESGEDA